MCLPRAKNGAFTLQPGLRLCLAGLGLGVGWCIYIFYLNQTFQKFHVIIAANVSSVCFTSRLLLFVPDDK